MLIVLSIGSQGVYPCNTRLGIMLKYEDHRGYDEAIFVTSWSEMKMGFNVTLTV